MDLGSTGSIDELRRMKTVAEVRRDRAKDELATLSSSVVSLRKRNRIRTNLGLLEGDIGRIEKRLRLEHRLEKEKTAADQAWDGAKRRRVANARKPAPLVSAKGFPPITAAREVLGDVLMVDADTGDLKDTLVDIDDLCECGSAMRRNMSLSVLVCSNPDCRRVKTYSDVSGGGANVTFSHKTDSNSQPQRKCLTHYVAYLKTIQGKVARRYDKDFLYQLSRYLYIEGCTSGADVNKKKVNLAQAYIGEPDYTNTPVMIVQLAGGIRKMPVELENMLICMLEYMLPVFERRKADLKPGRNNMVNFAYITHKNLKLLGYDIYLHACNPFDMPSNNIRHGAFLRSMYPELGWIWEDGTISDRSDKELDAFEFREAMLRQGT